MVLARTTRGVVGSRVTIVRSVIGLLEWTSPAVHLGHPVAGRSSTTHVS